MRRIAFAFCFFFRAYSAPLIHDLAFASRRLCRSTFARNVKRYRCCISYLPTCLTYHNNRAFCLFARYTTCTGTVLQPLCRTTSRVTYSRLRRGACVYQRTLRRAWRRQTAGRVWCHQNGDNASFDSACRINMLTTITAYDVTLRCNDAARIR